MSYAITNDNSNSSLMAEIFSRRTQENSALQKNQEKPQNKIVDTNAHANNEARANSTEYPRPSMNALMFVEEQSSASAIKDEQDQANAIEENTQTDELYMVGDPRADAGTTYMIGKDYRLQWNSDLNAIQGKNTLEYLAYANEYGTEKADEMFNQKYGYDFYATGSPSRYFQEYMEANDERLKLIQEEFYSAMEDLGIEATQENYYALTEDKELLQKVEDRLAERMSALGIEPNPDRGKQL